MIISNSSFISNSASESGGVIISLAKIAIFTEDNIFFNNTAIYGPNFASYVHSFGLTAYRIINETNVPKGNSDSLPKLLSQNISNIDFLYRSSENNMSLFQMINISSGSVIDVNFYFEALDHYNQTLMLMNGR